MLFWTVVFGGNLIEILTGLESEIGCFWESQAVAMVLGGRFPFYCVWGMYVFMGYLPTALAMACDLDPLGEAGLDGANRVQWPHVEIYGRALNRQHRQRPRPAAHVGRPRLHAGATGRAASRVCAACDS